MSSSASFLHRLTGFVLLIVACSLVPLMQSSADFSSENKPVNFAKKGISMAAFETNSFFHIDGFLDRAVYDNVNWTAINVFLYQDTYTEVEIYRDNQKTASDQAIIDAIQDAHNRGIKVFLKINVDSKDDVWRAEFEPSNVDTWFANYGAIMNEYAQLAQANNVELFSVGCEYKSLTVSSNTAQWETVIENIREIFTIGELVYSSDWGEYSQVEFWDKLDFIGIDAYFPLTADNNATPEAIYQAWTNSQATNYQGQNWFQEIKDFRESAAGHNKKVIFTEIGYPSADGGGNEPWNYNLTVSNEDLQKNLYDGTLNFWSEQDWLEGVFLWEWVPELILQSGAGTNHLIMNKPAEEIIRSYYGEIPVNYPSVVFPSEGETVDQGQMTIVFDNEKTDLPVYSSYDWDNGNTMGWFPGDYGNDIAFGNIENSTEQANSGEHSLAIDVDFSEDYATGFAWVDLDQETDLSNASLSVELWSPSGLVYPYAPAGVQFGLLDSSWIYADTTWTNILISSNDPDDWNRYTANLPNDINHNDGINFTKVRRIGFKIGRGSTRFKGRIYIDDFSFNFEEKGEYNIQVADNAEFDTPLIDENLNNTIFYVPNAANWVEGEYYWRVREKDGGNWGNWNNAVSFRYEFTPQIIHAHDGTIHWKFRDSAETYAVYAWGIEVEDPQGNEDIVSVVMKKPDETIYQTLLDDGNNWDTAAGDGIYGWTGEGHSEIPPFGTYTIEARDRQGNVAVHEFEIDKIIGFPTNLSPGNLGLVNPDQPQFSWNNAPDVIKNDLNIYDEEFNGLWTKSDLTTVPVFYNDDGTAQALTKGETYGWTITSFDSEDNQSSYSKQFIYPTLEQMLDGLPNQLEEVHTSFVENLHDQDLLDLISQKIRAIISAWKIQ